MIELARGNPISGNFGTVYQGHMRNLFRWSPAGALVAVEVFLVHGKQMDWTKELYVRFYLISRFGAT